MSKQDRQGARTAAELEQKYNLGMNFGDVQQLVKQAQREAADAKAAVSDLNARLDQKEIVERITEDGKYPVLFIVGDNVYADATYIKRGALKSVDESIVIDLDNNTVSMPYMDAIEAQTVYTAMMTDTLAPWQMNGIKANIEKWYDAALWTADMVNASVDKGILTSAEASGILT